MLRRRRVAMWTYTSTLEQVRSIPDAYGRAEIQSGAMYPYLQLSHCLRLQIFRYMSAMEQERILRAMLIPPEAISDIFVLSRREVAE